MPAQRGDQLILAHRRAAFELQLTRPLPELLNAALLVGAPVELAVLPGRRSLRGLWLLRVPLLGLSLGGVDQVHDLADALTDSGLDRYDSGVDLAGGDTGH